MLTKDVSYSVQKQSSGLVQKILPWTLKRILVYSNTPFFEGVQQQENPPNKPGNALSDAPLMSGFQKSSFLRAGF